jgi:phage shock protein PspC (stress-responsive transcriptional regulator)
MEKKLQRNEQDKILAGVCSGLADYFDVDVTWIRIAFIVATLAGFSGVIAYVILWIAVPARPYFPGAYNSKYGRPVADYRVYEDRDQPASGSSPYTVPEPPVDSDKARRSGNGRMIAGLLMIAFGAFFLFDEFNIIPYWFDFDKLWPLVFIIPGILIISKTSKRREYRDEPRNPADNANTTSSTGTITQEEEPKL